MIIFLIFFFKNQQQKAKEANSAVVIELISTLERANLKNARKRAKYSENPERFMESEIELAQAIKGLNALKKFSNKNLNCIQNKVNLANTQFFYNR